MLITCLVIVTVSAMVELEQKVDERKGGDEPVGVVYSFDFIRSRAISEQDVNWLAAQKTIQMLDVSGSGITPEQLARILRSSDVRGLRLGPNRFPKDILVVIGRETNLRTLSISGSRMPQNDLKPLRNCRQLKTLILGNAQWDIDIDEKTLARFSSLCHLAITGRSISEPELRSFAKLSHIRHLQLIHLSLESHPGNNAINILHEVLPDAAVSIGELDPFATNTNHFSDEKCGQKRVVARKESKR